MQYPLEFWIKKNGFAWILLSWNQKSPLKWSEFILNFHLLKSKWPQEHPKPLTLNKHIISIIYLYIYIYESLTTLRLLGDTAPSKAARRWKMLSCSRMSFATVGSSVLLPREAGLSYHQLQPWGFVSQNSGIEDLWFAVEWYPHVSPWIFLDNPWKS